MSSKAVTQQHPLAAAVSGALARISAHQAPQPSLEESYAELFDSVDRLGEVRELKRGQTVTINGRLFEVEPGGALLVSAGGALHVYRRLAREEAPTSVTVRSRSRAKQPPRRRTRADYGA